MCFNQQITYSSIYLPKRQKKQLNVIEILIVALEEFYIAKDILIFVSDRNDRRSLVDDKGEDSLLQKSSRTIIVSLTPMGRKMTLVIFNTKLQKDR